MTEPTNAVETPVHETKHFIRDGLVICTEEPGQGCRRYPGCECDMWFEGHHEQPGHEPVYQENCWAIDWINGPGDLLDTFEDADEFGLVTFPDGAIEIDWQGDYALWSYIDGTVPVPAGDDL